MAQAAKAVKEHEKRDETTLNILEGRLKRDALEVIRTRSGAIKRIPRPVIHGVYVGKIMYFIPAAHKPGRNRTWYTTVISPDPSCDCPDYEFRCRKEGSYCKHIVAGHMMEEQRNEYLEAECANNGGQ